MRIRLTAQLACIIVLFCSNCIFYFNSGECFRQSQWLYKNFTRIESRRHREEFCIAYNVTTAKEDYRKNGLEPVTLAIHGTPSYWKFIFRQVREWDGPISLSLFVDYSSQAAIDMLYSVHLCRKDFAQKISIHVVYRLAPFTTSCSDININALSCDKVTDQEIEKTLNDLRPPFTIYPINVMRNAARRGASTNFQLIADIEMVFSEKFAQIATDLANKHICSTCGKIIVLRRFELDEKVKEVPRTITDLKQRIDNKTAFEFHHKTFPVGHTIPGLSHWFTISANTSQPSTWEIPYKGASWEPQIIMHSSAPYGEEYVPTRFMDQQAFIYELCRANYTFLLASHIFNVHEGIKISPTPLERAVTEHQKPLKHRYYTRYNERINKLYPDSKNKCGKF